MTPSNNSPSYLTISGTATAEIDVKRSRFVAVILPVSSDQAAKAIIDGQRRLHHAARHHCSAYILAPTILAPNILAPNILAPNILASYISADRPIGSAPALDAAATLDRPRAAGVNPARPASSEGSAPLSLATERANDDGEPAGTAGMPMLDVLRGAQLMDVIAVVTRYFGGTLLGAGGLVRAYSDAASAACKEAKPLRRSLFQLFAVAVDHARAGQVEAQLRNRSVRIHSVEYETNAVLTLAVEPHHTAELTSIVAGITAGAGTLRPVGYAWVQS
ncbi:YigZ family protein [Nakamurella antarctica]|uniref:YigZ family protein n=1 Tax=Nakamurella antarctica TaxID=1902245 RepID=UPI0013DE384B